MWCVWFYGSYLYMIFTMGKKMFFRFFFVFSISFLVSGCATESKYQAILDSWMGHSELSLIQSWGPPQQTYSTSKHKFLVYSNSHKSYISGTSPTYQTTVIGNTAYTTSYGGTSGVNVYYSCKTVFDVVDGVIVSWSYRGNNCVSW